MMGNHEIQYYEIIRPAVVPAEERRAGEGVILGLGETRSLRCLAGSRCLGSGRGRAPGPCLESREDDEEERERERMPVGAMQKQKNKRRNPSKKSNEMAKANSIAHINN